MTSRDGGECPVCYNRFVAPGAVKGSVDRAENSRPSIPLLLVSGHTLCGACIDSSINCNSRMANSQHSLLIQCPTCRRNTGIRSLSCSSQTQLSPQLKLPLNHELLNQLDHIDRFVAKNPLFCDSCHQRMDLSRTRICLDCERTRKVNSSIICTSCAVDHHNGHLLRKLDDVIGSPVVLQEVIEDLVSTNQGRTWNGVGREPFSVIVTRVIQRHQNELLLQLSINLTSKLTSSEVPMSEYYELFHGLFAKINENQLILGRAMGKEVAPAAYYDVEEMLQRLFHP